MQEDRVFLGHWGRAKGLFTVTAPSYRKHVIPPALHEVRRMSVLGFVGHFMKHIAHLAMNPLPRESVCGFR